MLRLEIAILTLLTNRTQNISRKFWNQLAVRLGCEICFTMIIFEKTKSSKLKVSLLNFKNSLGMWIEHDLNYSNLATDKPQLSLVNNFFSN